MQKELLKFILEEARQSAAKFHLYHNTLSIEHRRKKRRLGAIPKKVVYFPEAWGKDKKFVPFYVIKHSEKIAKAIYEKIKNKKYVPEEPFITIKEKPSGGTRKITVFQIPDSAVSDMIYRDLLRKNKHRFSSFAYAYRNDRNVHFAIQDISNEIRNAPRLFIAEFDFSNFFGSIQHSFLYNQMEKNCFQISQVEKLIIEGFLSRESGVGIPLGNSISLFLSNLACWELDKKLEEEGLRFARYADDTIIWTKSYSKICRAFEIINDFTKLSGVSINYKKSEGISLLQKNGLKSEFTNSKRYIEFLGYQITAESVGIKTKSVHKIKKEISFILYKNLIQPIHNRQLTPVNIPDEEFDPFFLQAIMQIRRYLYGDLNEYSLFRFLNGSYTKLTFKGVMSYYPLIDDEIQMQEFDKWMVCTIINIIKRREKIFIKSGYDVHLVFPFNALENEFVSQCRERKLRGKKHRFQIPSFMKIMKAMKIGITNNGIESVINRKSFYYDE